MKIKTNFDILKEIEHSKEGIKTNVNKRRKKTT